MAQTIENIEKQLEELRARYKKVDEAWRNTGNKGLLAFFVEIIPRLVDTERCSIFIHDPANESVWVQCGTGVGEREIEVPTKDSLVGEVIASREPVMRMGLDNKIGVHEKVDKQTEFTTSNILCVPIFSADGTKVTGAVEVLNKRWGANYSEQDRETLEKFAVQLQQNIDNLFMRQEWGRFLILAEKKIEELEQAKARLSGVPFPIISD
ncbi:GAF domain-containing protein [Endothiovibrio diazotrophicus]